MRKAKLFLVLLIGVLVLSSCSRKKYEIELNSTVIFETGNKTEILFEFSIDKENDILIIMESTHLIEATLLDGNGDSLETIEAYEVNWDTFITFRRTLEEGKYKVKVKLDKNSLSKVELHIYEPSETIHNLEIGFELKDDFLPGEDVTINFSVDEAGFYEIDQDYARYSGRWDLYGVTNSDYEYHKELYFVNPFTFYLEPGEYRLELTHWHDYTSGRFRIEVVKTPSRIGNVFDSNTVSGTVESLGDTYHFLTVEEEGIYAVYMDSDFYGGISFSPITEDASSSVLKKLENAITFTYMSAFTEDNIVYVEFSKGEYLVSVYGIKEANFGDYTIDLEKSNIIENTTITNQGIAYEMVESSSPIKNTSTVTVEITEPGIYKVSYQGSFIPNIYMYNILDYEEKSKYFDFYSGDQIEAVEYLEIGTYIIGVTPHFGFGNGLNKIEIEFVEE